jgi:hypothetical protein
VFHVELRETIHNTHLFNLEDGDLEERIVGPWLRDKVIDVGERRWSPARTRLTILEGPQLGLGELGLGRGWSNAVRRGRDVTAELLDAKRAMLPTAATVPLRELDYEHELLALCASEAVSPYRAWQLADEVSEDPAPWQRLALAEGTLRQLLLDGKVELAGRARGSAPLEAAAVDALLGASESWLSERKAGAVARATDAGRAVLAQ